MKNILNKLVNPLKLLAAILFFASGALLLPAQSNSVPDTDTNPAPATHHDTITYNLPPPDRNHDQYSDLTRLANAAIPLVVGSLAVIGTFGFLVAAFIYLHRRDKFHHETLRAMIDKGVPIPPELLGRSDLDRSPRPGSDMRKGLILVGLGLGLALGISGRVGCIVLLMGVAFLVAARLEKKNQGKDQPPQTPPPVQSAPPTPPSQPPQS